MKLKLNQLLIFIKSNLKNYHYSVIKQDFSNLKEYAKQGFTFYFLSIKYSIIYNLEYIQYIYMKNLYILIDWKNKVKDHFVFTYWHFDIIWSITKLEYLIFYIKKKHTIKLFLLHRYSDVRLSFLIIKFKIRYYIIERWYFFFAVPLTVYFWVSVADLTLTQTLANPEYPDWLYRTDFGVKWVEVIFFHFFISLLLIFPLLVWFILSQRFERDVWANVDLYFNLLVSTISMQYMEYMWMAMNLFVYQEIKLVIYFYLLATYVAWHGIEWIEDAEEETEEDDLWDEDYEDYDDFIEAQSLAVVIHARRIPWTHAATWGSQNYEESTAGERANDIASRSAGLHNFTLTDPEDPVPYFASKKFQELKKNPYLDDETEVQNFPDIEPDTIYSDLNLIEDDVEILMDTFTLQATAELEGAEDLDYYDPEQEKKLRIKYSDEDIFRQEEQELQELQKKIRFPDKTYKPPEKKDIIFSSTISKDASFLTKELINKIKNIQKKKFSIYNIMLDFAATVYKYRKERKFIRYKFLSLIVNGYIYLIKRSSKKNIDSLDSKRVFEILENKLAFKIKKNYFVRYLLFTKDRLSYWLKKHFWVIWPVRFKIYKAHLNIFMSKIGMTIVILGRANPLPYFYITLRLKWREFECWVYSNLDIGDHFRKRGIIKPWGEIVRMAKVNILDFNNLRWVLVWIYEMIRFVVKIIFFTIKHPFVYRKKRIWVVGPYSLYDFYYNKNTLIRAVDIGPRGYLFPGNIRKKEKKYLDGPATLHWLINVKKPIHTLENKKFFNIISKSIISKKHS